MPRVFMILAGATLVVFAWLFYQYTAQQQEEAELIEYEIVLNEKTAEIFDQAQDWSKPIQLDIEEDRLDGDYAVMAESGAACALTRRSAVNRLSSIRKVVSRGRIRKTSASSFQWEKPYSCLNLCKGAEYYCERR
jgi:hypothetical protein